MYNAIIMGRGKRIQADSLKQLIQKLSRENIRIRESELIRQQERIEAGHPVVVMSERKLTQNEIIRMRMRPPYLGNPFQHVQDTERVSLRITYFKNHNREEK